MSVQNESLDMKSSERKLSAPELEYKAASQDSLSMFFAAIGGAVLGTLATLLVLAIINGGTLNFTRPERLAVMESNLARVSENVGAVSQNLDIVASQVTEVRDQLARARSELDAAATKLQNQDSALANLQNAVAGLAVTGERFDVLVAALDQALISMRKIEGSPVARTPTRAIAAPALIVNDASVPANAIAVLFFVDHNGNGVMDADEVNLTGVKIRVTNTDGALVGEFVSDDAGVMVENLAPGAYTISVVDTAGHATLSEEIEVTVQSNATEGQILYVPMAR
ncbi:MAG: hypothetical protein NZ553_10840 [Caldilinea sp.]|nr:hypothetical protein [Caldilinea sp.]MDW8440959.1 SdrD B-like domain-containing protein [Caldilineaceae bacterium]